VASARAAAHEPTLLYELPAPRTANLDAFLTHTEGPVLAGAVKVMAADARMALQLPKAQQLQLDAVLSELQQALARADSAELRLEANRRAITAIATRLEPDSARRFREFSDGWIADEIMKINL
jgi:hypothetical protein